MTKAQANFIVNKYWRDVERESAKVLAHTFLSHRDWSNPDKVSEFIEALSAFVEFTRVRFEQVRGLRKLKQNEGDVSEDFARYCDDAHGFVPIRTIATFLAEPSFRQRQSLRELNDMLDAIVHNLRILEQRHKPETRQTSSENQVP